MKILKILLLTIWGFITIGFLILATIHRQDSIVYKCELVNQKNINVKLTNEYKRNIKTIKELYPNNVKIDSIMQNSEFLNYSYREN